jgi:hypothetical protein
MKISCFIGAKWITKRRESVTWNHPRSRRIPQTHLQPAVFIEESIREIKRMEPIRSIVALTMAVMPDILDRISSE